MTKEEKAIREFCGQHADWWPSITQVQEMLALAHPKQMPVVGCAECGANGNFALYCVTCAENYLKEKNTRGQANG